MASVYGLWVSIMFIRSEWTGNFQLHISLSENMLPYLAVSGHYKYTLTIKKCIQDIKNLYPCFGKFYNEGSFNRSRNDQLFFSGTFTDQVIEKTLMGSGKSNGGLINNTHNDTTRTKMVTIVIYSRKSRRNTPGLLQENGLCNTVMSKLAEKLKTVFPFATLSISSIPQFI